MIGRARTLEIREISTVDKESDRKTDDYDEMNDVRVPTEHRDDVGKIINCNRDLFARSDADLGVTSTVKMSIKTGNNSPIRHRPYRTPLNNRRIVDNAIDEMMKAGIIERSQSAWAFPLVVVKKKDGSERMCVDFRSLNKIVEPISFPIPRIDDILSQLGEAKYFTTLDLKSGYWQVRLDEESKKKTAFTCHKGLFQFNVMPFGLSNAPAVFQELMNIVLQGCEEFSTAYLDDILIFSSSIEEHLKHIQTVFDRIREHGLKLKLKKCTFFETETEYLGFIISKEGVKPDSKKVEAIKTLPRPKNVRQVRGFIGMCSYYRRFIPNFSAIAEPLLRLIRKYARFSWDKDCQTAFDFLRDSLTVVPLLAFPDPRLGYVLYTDASDTCIGACLTQTTDGEEKPIYYLSHKLTPTQRRWAVIEKEAFAIHYSLQKLNHYLHNAKFVIRTDHKPLKYLLESPMENKKIQLWALSMAGYNTKIEYIEGKYNCCADLLSRLPDQEESQNGSPEQHITHQSEGDGEPDIDDRTLKINAINSNEFEPRDFAECQLSDTEPDLQKADTDLPKTMDIKKEQARDPDIEQLKGRLNTGKATKSEENKFLETEGILYYLSNADSEEPRMRLYIPSHLEPLVIHQYHDALGHMAVDKTHDSIRKKYYFPNQYKKLTMYIEKCVTCQKRSPKNPHPPQQETGVPPYPFAKIGLDISGPYPTTLSGNRYIVSFIDLYSGWPEAYCVPDKAADNIVHLILEEIIPRFGCPLQILTDNGSENINKKVKETLKTMNIHHITTSFYCPQSNGKVERFHSTLVNVISKKISDDIHTWDLYLNQTLAAVRFHDNESTQCSPFFLLYNRDVVLPLDTILQPRRRYHGEDVHRIGLEQQHKSFVRVHRRLKNVKRKQKENADIGSKMEDLQVGSPVYLRNYQRKNKLDNKWQPFYRITGRSGPLTFQVRSQLTGHATTAHARHLRLANVGEWIIPQGNVRGRKTTMAVASDDETDDDADDEGGVTNENDFQRVIDRQKREREASSDEENMPIFEHQRRLRCRDQLEAQDASEQSELNDNDEHLPNDDVDNIRVDRDISIENRSNGVQTDLDSLRETRIDDRYPRANEENMEIDVVSGKTKTTVPPQDSKLLVKNLLSAVQALL